MHPYIAVGLYYGLRAVMIHQIAQLAKDVIVLAREEYEERRRRREE